MIKRTVSFTGFDGKEHTEDIYLNLTKMEVFKFMKKHGIDASNTEASFKTFISNMTKDGDVLKMLETMEEIVLLAYGKKSEDGLHFLKTRAIREEFSKSLAYETFFNQLIEDPTLAKALGEELGK